MFNRKGFTLIFFFNDTATTDIYTLSLHDALPISKDKAKLASVKTDLRNMMTAQEAYRSEEHTSELQSHSEVVCSHPPLTSDNTATAVGATNGWTATVANTTISTGFTHCTVQVGAG